MSSNRDEMGYTPEDRRRILHALRAMDFFDVPTHDLAQLHDAALRAGALRTVRREDERSAIVRIVESEPALRELCAQRGAA